MKEEELVKIAESGSQKYNARQMELLRQFASIDFGTNDEEGNAEVVKIVAQDLAGLGANCEFIHTPGLGTHVVARLKPENPTGKIIINSHLDTVFHRGDTQKHPFRIEGDWAYGLGVADCKGGFVTSVFAVKIMQEAGLLPNKEIVFIYNCDEETGSHAGRKIFEREAEGAEYAFVFEPARNQNGIITRRKGLAYITISVQGVEAHAALNYRNGASATMELAHKMVMLDSMENEAQGIHYNIGPVSGGMNPLVVSASAQCQVSVSLDSPDSLEYVEKDMARLKAAAFVSGCSTEADIDLMFPTQEHSDKNVALYQIVHKAGQMIGLDLPEEFSSGPSDAGFFSTCGVATVDALGPYMQDIHTTNERMYIPALDERTRLFCLVLGLL